MHGPSRSIQLNSWNVFTHDQLPLSVCKAIYRQATARVISNVLPWTEILDAGMDRAAVRKGRRADCELDSVLLLVGENTLAGDMTIRCVLTGAVQLDPVTKPFDGKRHEAVALVS